MNMKSDHTAFKKSLQ